MKNKKSKKNFGGCANCNTVVGGCSCRKEQAGGSLTSFVLEVKKKIETINKNLLKNNKSKKSIKNTKRKNMF